MMAWILSLMLVIAPHSSRVESFDDTARDIEEACTETPIAEGPHAFEECASTVVAVAFFESSFFRWAIGDGGASVGLMQIHRSNFRTLGLTRDDLLAPRVNLRAWLSMVARNGTTGTLEHRIGFGLMTPEQARQRASLARRLVRSHPFIDTTPKE